MAVRLLKGTTVTARTGAHPQAERGASSVEYAILVGLVAIIILVVASAIAAAVKVLVEGSLGGLSYGKVLANLASIFILFLGVVAALNQVGVATTVTTPVLIAILATVGGVIVVGVGGGLIKPMQHRWERYLSNAEAEAPRIREHASNAPGVREQAQQARSQVSGGSTSGGSSAGFTDAAPTETYDPRYDGPAEGTGGTPRRFPIVRG